MFDTMIEADGVGLAGPQVGKKLRMFVAMADDDVRRVFINPQIITKAVLAFHRFMKQSAAL